MPQNMNKNLSVVEPTIKMQNILETVKSVPKVYVENLFLIDPVRFPTPGPFLTCVIKELKLSLKISIIFPVNYVMREICARAMERDLEN